ncbi:hypothetical protein VB735_00430 [Halotia wernerae UHCC 0503]|jgi:hypothetical protein|nr:hypothetical protein [Halotia wernerae UHCC 0503]
MERISLPFIYSFGQAVSSFLNIDIAEDKRRGDIRWQTDHIVSFVRQFENGALYAPHFKSSRNLATTFLNQTKGLLEGSPDDVIGRWTILFAQESLRGYLAPMLAEMSILDIYLVQRKGAYDIKALLSEGFTLFPSELGRKVPNAIQDSIDAAKCLAFEMPNACAFHTFRVLEHTVRAFAKLHITIEPGKEGIPLGTYISRLKDERLGIDKTIIETLTLIKDSHRNPLIHPEDHLNVDEAISIIGICHSAMTLMLNEIPAPPFSIGDISAPGS